MKIWVDADACPLPVKSILYRVAERKQIEVILVANVPLLVPPSPFIRCLHVEKGSDVADFAIVAGLEPGDLVVTADIPLAADAIQKGAFALNPRGELYTRANIHERLVIRNLLDEFRFSGEMTGGPAPYRPKDRQAFANQLDRFLNQFLP